MKCSGLLSCLNSFLCTAFSFSSSLRIKPSIFATITHEMAAVRAHALCLGGASARSFPLAVLRLVVRAVRFSWVCATLKGISEEYNNRDISQCTERARSL